MFTLLKLINSLKMIFYLRYENHIIPFIKYPQIIRSDFCIESTR
ncbi:hypothetical protein FM107_19945 [Sphingobacterium sp. JB170]|nr:hypothetical protein FM107_19945 [Sphingobacterium sp. JB170]